ncbi:DNA polymerase, family X, beta-like [Plasmopara halstedii]|uniref:DNA polymerase n=1 Tax=Plasmopara halstedii TaxID=4781 RepID=A0A0P1B314_PLAHL|nr:DNA polymerase, family X, beta-like [Plasmopara halstedii]CEG48237.1 DNA polymerase, family X, beta-like [Plasmopara halstedii]|eukprot:XP_024584606.1 DNA polymerase, family X, beta-like [Plasmopara halstedii]
MTITVGLSPRLVLHPQRKRKFFEDLAQLLDEEPPEIYPLQGAFYGPELPMNAALHPPSSLESSNTTQPIVMPSHSLNALNAINNNSLNSSNSRTQQRKDQRVHFEFELETKNDKEKCRRGGNCAARFLVTTLSKSGVMSEKTPVGSRLELIDYYDVDRMCEASPCWLYNNEATCAMHEGFIRRPMLLFSLQALDEFIARCEWFDQQRWHVQACKVARRVLTAMWENDVLDSESSGQDLVLRDYIFQKSSVNGVALEVWRIIARYWEKYKQNYLHHQELYFDEAKNGEITSIASEWDQARSLLNVYGMKSNRAQRLLEQEGGNYFNVRQVIDKLIRAQTHDIPIVEQLRVGIDFIVPASGLGSSPIVRRPNLNQKDGKMAFNAILIHLKNWNTKIQVFPCGSFSRGAAFISVLDILVAVPTVLEISTTANADVDAQQFEEVITALTAANVIQHGAMRRISTSRGACIIPFKTSTVLLDIKIFSPPKSWIALLYFTGPESFVLSFFSDLLKQSLQEISNTSFDCIYTSVVEAIGLKALLKIASEKDLFELCGRRYLQPTDRL